MSNFNLGRVQGGSVFTTIKNPEPTIDGYQQVTRDQIEPKNLQPFIGDSILFNLGDVYTITDITQYGEIICKPSIHIRGEAPPIVDRLDSTSTIEALSANMGYKLNHEKGGLNTTNIWKNIQTYEQQLSNIKIKLNEQNKPLQLLNQDGLIWGTDSFGRLISNDFCYFNQGFYEQDELPDGTIDEHTILHQGHLYLQHGLVLEKDESGDAMSATGNISINGKLNIYPETTGGKTEINVEGPITGTIIKGTALYDENNRVYSASHTPPLNSATEPGYVNTAGSTHKNQVWKTDGNGNPGWMDEKDTWRPLGDTANTACAGDDWRLEATQVQINTKPIRSINFNSDPQDQLDSKMPIAGGTFTGTVSFGTGSLNTNGNMVCTHLKVSNIDAAQNSNAFATVDGGWIKYRSNANVKNDLGINDKLGINDTAAAANKVKVDNKLYTLRTGTAGEAGYITFVL